MGIDFGYVDVVEAVCDSARVRVLEIEELSSYELVEAEKIFNLASEEMRCRRYDQALALADELNKVIHIPAPMPIHSIAVGGLNSL